MAAINWDDVLAIAAELTTTPAAARVEFLGYANTTLVVADFGGETSSALHLARCYLAAHMATIQAQGSRGTAGPVTQETEDRLSKSYAQPYGGMAAPDSLDSTAYGKAYRQIVRRSYARAPVVL